MRLNLQGKRSEDYLTNSAGFIEEQRKTQALFNEGQRLTETLDRGLSAIVK